MPSTISGARTSKFTAPPPTNKTSQKAQALIKEAVKPNNIPNSTKSPVERKIDNIGLQQALEVARVTVVDGLDNEDYVVIGQPPVADVALPLSMDAKGKVEGEVLTPQQIDKLQQAILQRAYATIEVPEAFVQSTIDYFLKATKTTTLFGKAKDVDLSNTALGKTTKDLGQQVTELALTNTKAKNNILRQLTGKGNAESFHRDSGPKAIVIASALVGSGTIMVAKKDFSEFSNISERGLRTAEVEPQTDAIYEHISLPKNQLAIFLAEGVEDLPAESRPNWLQGVESIPSVAAIHASPASASGVDEAVEELKMKGLQGQPLLEEQASELTEGRLILLSRFNIDPNS
jgi:hypothetical protein